MDNKENNPAFKKYKLHAIKAYSSDEWMMGATKKYRQVFDRQETTYVRVEFSFYNKLFDEGDWDTTVVLKCIGIDGEKRTEICNLDTKLNVKSDQNIVYVRDGWGNATPGSFWKKGKFIWEAYIDNELVGSLDFFIEDVGYVAENYNPYFTVESLKLYNSGYDWIDEDKRQYLKKFKRDETLYVWAELKIRSKVAYPWQCELFFNFYDDAGQLKGQVINLEKVSVGKDAIFTSDAGWGNKTAGSWKDTRYTVEIVFMDTLIAVIPFEVGDNSEVGVTEYSKTAVNTVQGTVQTPETQETLEEVVKNLDELIGLNEIKKKIKDHISYLNFIKIRKEKGLSDSESLSLHSVFTGNPGTGKTTVVKLLGKIYNKMGLLSKGHVIEVDRSDLVGEYIGQTAPKVKKAITDAKGGILFIDEAYMLYREGADSKDFGREVIEVLIKEMSDGDGDIAIMAAGYPSEMKSFIDSNPGLKSRFNYFFHFEDYSPEELIQIAQYHCDKKFVNLTEPALKILEEAIVEAYRNRDNTFGNARFAISLIDEAKMNMGLRLMNNPDVSKLSTEALSTIEEADILPILQGKKRKMIDIDINEKMLKESMQELNSLIGLQVIKTEINELVKLVRYYREIGKDVLNKFSLHTVFTGNPGTGKTTIARIIGKIYKALGLLERGHVIECDREALVAGYVGQTAIKTKDKIDEAMNGVLFIDEAYSLAPHSENDFGREAIEIILKNMEDNRGHLAVIVAGYTDNMHNFLESNPGLKSRFDRTLTFPDYTPEELYQICLLMLSKEKLTPEKQAEEHIRKYLETVYQQRDKTFGNARTVRKLVEQAIKYQNLRMAGMEASQRTREMIETLSIEDVKEFKVEESGKKSLGFKV